MSANKEQKTFDATPSRKQKAKRDGNVARSSEVSGVIAFGCATVAAFAILPAIGSSTEATLKAIGLRPNPWQPPGGLIIVLGLSLIPACAAALGACGAGLLQGGGLRLSAPKWQMSRLNVVAGLKRMLGGEAIVAALRAVIAFTLATLAIWPLVFEIFSRAATLSGPPSLMLLAMNGAQRACWAAIATGALFAAADYALVRRRWLRELKMTFEEMRRDHKESEGDPHSRSRRKALHRTFARGSIARTKEASFVVVNPTHIAVAIRYAPPGVAVPEILVRAADAGAHQVKLLARRHGIPIVENIALARALFAQGEAGRAIPSPTFVAVAQVIAALAHAGVLP